MREQWIGAALVAALSVLFAAPLAAQQRPNAPGQPSIMEEDEADAPPMTPPPAATKPARRARTQAPPPQPDPDLDPEDELAPSQMRQQMPGAAAAPSGGTRRAATRPAAPVAADAETPPPAHPTAAARIPARPPLFKSVACGGGTFSRDSSSLKLASIFDSRNITFTEIDVSGSKVGATVLFPKDAKKRLEVWWNNPGNRSDIYLIVITGQSTWGGPDGMRLGLTLPELEKLNKKPFKVKGFDKDRVATISDWDGGTLATLQGGCKFGISLKADAKAAADALDAVSGDKEYASDDPAIRAVKPAVSEVLIGY